MKFVGYIYVKLILCNNGSNEKDVI